jgi:glutamine synthetase type III
MTLLRAAMQPQCDHIGANEAPPAIICVYWRAIDKVWQN